VLFGIAMMVAAGIGNMALHEFAPVIYTTPKWMESDGVEAGWGTYAGSPSHIHR